jgi:FolB domain-containing protein
MDKICIRDLKVKTIIGTLPEERETAQKLRINIELDLHLKPAGESDDLNDTVNYAEIEDRVIEMAGKSKFYLIERFAEEVAAICLSYKKIMRAVVTIDKPKALRKSRSVAVQIERSAL